MDVFRNCEVETFSIRVEGRIHCLLLVLVLVIVVVVVAVVVVVVVVVVQ